MLRNKHLCLQGKSISALLMNLLMNTIYVFKNIVMFLNDNKCEIRASQVAVVKNLSA